MTIYVVVLNVFYAYISICAYKLFIVSIYSTDGREKLHKRYRTCLEIETGRRRLIVSIEFRHII